MLVVGALGMGVLGSLVAPTTGKLSWLAGIGATLSQFVLDAHQQIGIGAGIAFVTIPVTGFNIRSLRAIGGLPVAGLLLVLSVGVSWKSGYEPLEVFGRLPGLQKVAVVSIPAGAYLFLNGSAEAAIAIIPFSYAFDGVATIGVVLYMYRGRIADAIGL